MPKFLSWLISIVIYALTPLFYLTPPRPHRKAER
jgi:hypothetical protein